MLTQSLKKLIPIPLYERWYNTFAYGPSDLLDAALGRRPDLVPPRRMIFIGAGDFIAVGDLFLKYFIDIGGLRPDAAVLDVGSGIGRMARPLTSYLAANGRYEGLDIDADGVEWCRRNITPRFPNFRFQRADVYNKRYNPQGRAQPRDYRFPYEDASFDFIFLTSVFTHMYPEDVDRYLREMGRVLRPGGRTMSTCFLLNAESRALIAKGKSTPPFPHAIGDSLTSDEVVPESAIALDEAAVLASHAAGGLAVEGVHYGSWCGRAKHLSYQDIVVARRA